MNVFIATILNGTAELRTDESWHCARVLRYRAGEKVRLIDGNGSFYEAELTDVNEKKCTAAILSGPVVQPARPYRFHLAIAPTKNIDRMEWLVEKAVEIGLDEITFLRCRNSERTVIKTDRMQRIAESAVKQSLQARLPQINELTDLKKVIETAADVKLIAHCYDDNRKTIQQHDIKGKSIMALVGPEGDFTQEEVSMATAKGFTPVTLGSNRLRTETAGLFICNACAVMAMDL